MHPTAIPGEDKLRLMSRVACAARAAASGCRRRRATPATRGHPRGERWYFLEEKYPKYKNLVPRDVATREIFHVCRDLGLGVGGEDAVYLDVTHIPAARRSTRSIEGVMEIYEKFVGDDPRHEPMQIFPAMHYSMGGLWVSFEPGRTRADRGSPMNQATNIPGLFAAGEVDYAVPRREPPRRQLAALLHLRRA